MRSNLNYLYKYYSKFVPCSRKKNGLRLITGMLLLLICMKTLAADPLNEISTYYIRFDLKSSSQRITDGKLTMVPAHEEFRAAKFSCFPISGIIPASPQEANQTIEAKVKQNAFIQLLEQQGLKSVKTLNYDTIVSYEGCVQMPIALLISPYDDKNKGFPYTARILFSPLSFPDQWDSLRQRFKIKKLLDNFFLFFQ
nr:hypothetical protein [uncultured Desulfobacter sp.]